MICFVPDPPEIEVEKSWVHSGEGYEALLVCIVHAEPLAEVSHFKIKVIIFWGKCSVMASEKVSCGTDFIGLYT